MKIRVVGAAITTILLALSACSSGGSGGDVATPGGNGNPSAPGANAASGDTILGPEGSMLFIPENALSQNTPISVGNGTNIAFPEGVTMAGPAIEASPAGLLFDKPATIGVPVDVDNLPQGVNPSELRVYAREADGSILSVPVVGYDDSRRLLYASISGFTTFQAAVPMFDFAIVPQTIKMGFLQAFYSETLSFANNAGGVTWELVSTMQTAGEALEAEEPEEGEEPTAPAPNEILPGVTISSLGTISGYPQTYGTWAFTVRATDSATTPHVAEVSHSITIASLEWHGAPSTPNDDQVILKYDDEGNGFALVRNGSAFVLSKLPHDAPTGQGVTSVAFAGGTQPSLAVAPDGSAVVVAYEQLVTSTMNLYTADLVQGIVDGGDGMVNNLAIDITGNGQPNLNISFPVDPAMGFTGSDQEIYAMADAINAQLSPTPSPIRAVANAVFSGVAIVDNGANVIGSNGLFNLRILPGGDAPFGVRATYNNSLDANNQRIYAREFNGDLMPVGQARRVDQDVTFPQPDPMAPPPAEGEEPEPLTLDPTLSEISRRAANPSVAFAQDRMPVPTGEEAEPEPVDPNAPPPEPEPLLYFVAFEHIRNTAADGGLRSDIYGRWMNFGSGAITAETRLDTTDFAGDSSGQIEVVASSAGAMVVWIEQGNDNAGTNQAGENDTPSAGSDGDLASSMIPLPTIPAMDEEGFGEPIEITPPEPTYLNAEATTTALHPTLALSRSNQFFAAWSERNDDDGTIGPRTLRKDVSLRVAEVTGGTAGESFLVDDAPLDSLVYATALAVRDDGMIAVTWAENFGGGLADGFLRRFSAPGMPIENPIEVSWSTSLNLEWLPDMRLSLLSSEGGSIARLRVEPEPEPPMPDPMTPAPSMSDE